MVGVHRSDRLLAYVERRLAGEEQAWMAAHLAACAACRQQAADLAQTVETLTALPAALRGVPSGARAQWPAVWVRVQRAKPAKPSGGLIPAAGRLAPRATVYLSLMVAALTATMAWPGGMAARLEAVTAGVVETPRAASVTPGTVAPVAAASSDTARAVSVTASLLAVPQGPVAVGTPVPGEGG